MKAVIVLGNIDKIEASWLENSYVIGVDKGAYLAYKKGIRLDVAIGDFDSISLESFNELKSNVDIIKLNPVKDETDTKEAIRLASKYDDILILGGIKGKRIEHFWANIIELYNNPKLSILDDYSYICTKNESFKPITDYKFVSFYSLEPNTNISLNGFKYNLDNYDLKQNDSLCISNEIVNDAYVTINSGRLLVIYSKGDSDEII